MGEQVYTMKVIFKGKPRILTVRVSNDSLELLLTDKGGQPIEYTVQKGRTLQFQRFNAPG